MYRLGRARTAELNGRNAGFTIIEVMLFLAISGALVVALLATVGSSISRSRFTDTVTSTQAFIQSEYAAVLNVQNDRAAGACGASGTAGTTDSGATSSNRGASNCVVLGQALDFTPGSSTVTTHMVIGTEPSATASAGVTGSALLALYAPGIVASSADSYTVPWGAPVTKVRVNGATTTVSRILLLRSPDSGVILTFADNGGSNLQGALTSGARAYNICVRSADLVSAYALVALSAVAGSEGVTTKSDLTSAEQGSLC